MLTYANKINGALKGEEGGLLVKLPGLKTLSIGVCSACNRQNYNGWNTTTFCVGVLGDGILVKEFCPEILMIRKLNIKEMERAGVQAADQLSGGFLIILRIHCSCGVPKNERHGSPHTGYSYGVSECWKHLTQFCHSPKLNSGGGWHDIFLSAHRIQYSNSCH